MIHDLLQVLGESWETRPVIVVLSVLALAVLIFVIVDTHRHRRKRQRQRRPPDQPLDRSHDQQHH